MHVKVVHAVPVEVGFYVFSAFVFVASILAILYGLLNINKTLRNAILRSRFINCLSNISLSTYLIHNCVIYWRIASAPGKVALQYREMMGYFLHDFFYTVIFGYILTLFVDIPLSRLFRKYVDGWYLRR